MLHNTLKFSCTPFHILGVVGPPSLRLFSFFGQSCSMRRQKTSLLGLTTKHYIHTYPSSWRNICWYPHVAPEAKQYRYLEISRARPCRWQQNSKLNHTIIIGGQTGFEEQNHCCLYSKPVFILLEIKVMSAKYSVSLQCVIFLYKRKLVWFCLKIWSHDCCTLNNYLWGPTTVFLLSIPKLF